MKRRSPVRTASRLALVATVAVTASTLAVAPASGAEKPKPRRATSVQGGALARAGKVRLAVELAPGANANAVKAAARENGAQVRHHMAQIRTVSVEVPAEAADRMEALLRVRPGVTAVHRVGTRSYDYTPNDTDYAAFQQSYFDEVNAPEAWDVSKGHTDVLIAVIDSGVDVAHPDLASKIAGQYNADTGTTNVTDFSGHGTFVAGVAAAASDNATGVTGAGFDARLLAVKVAAADGSMSTDDEANGIIWATDNGADIINISLGGAIDATEQSAVEYAISHGVLVVASAGNDNTSVKSYPAAYDDVLAVGATTGTERSTFSNFGSWVDVGAPGTNIRSTIPTAGSSIFPGPADYAVGNGTSFSSPLVAGEAALLLGLDQDASAVTIRNAINSATTPGSPDTYGFAHGRVDFQAAYSFLPPSTLPTWTDPATDGTTVTGNLSVTATSDAPKVRFAIANGPSVTVNVATGAATGTIETYGLAGLQTIVAYDCNNAGCNPNGTARIVNVDNAPPVITAPTDPATVTTSFFDTTATAPGGGVQFRIDGVAKAFDGTDPFTVSLNASALTAGSHTLTAVQCNVAGTICDAAHPSTGVTVDVQSLHPKVAHLMPNPFSPNKDGKVDTTTVTYLLDTTQNVFLRIKNATGTVVRGQAGGSSLGNNRAPGTYKYVWNGLRNDGTRAPDGIYTAEILTTASGGRTGFASGSVKLDTVAPGMASVGGNGTTFYPVTDSYKDTFSPSITVYERSHLYLNVFTSGGTRVRTIDAGMKNPGRYPVTWNGRRSDGSLVPAGTYYYSFTAIDPAYNSATTSRYRVVVSLKKAESRLAVETISPYGSVTAPYIGNCSNVYADSRADWPDSLGWYSNEIEPPVCTPDEVSDLALTEHAFAMKSAIKYGAVRIVVTGASSSDRPGSSAAVVFLDAQGHTTSYGFSTGSAAGSYAGPAVSADTVRDGRVVSWIAGTAGGNWWDVKSFTIRYVYYVLV